MKLPAESKFQRWKYVELARYVDSLKRVLREQNTNADGVKVARLIEWGDEVEQYRNKYNNRGLYTSVFHYDSQDPTTSTRLGSLYFDVDSNDGGLAAHKDALQLAEYLLNRIPTEAVRIYFTGKKGFHIECEAIALGIGPSNNLPGIFRFIASSIRDELSLESLDFSVYDLRRMWRLPNSQHQDTGLYKVELTFDELSYRLQQIIDLASQPRFEKEVPNQVFHAQSNAWYRDFVIEEELSRKKSKYSVHDSISYFAKHGSGSIHAPAEMEFDPVGLFKNCPVIMQHWESAERNHTLPHDARLFLCSILSYSDEALEYLHAILSNCDDYNPEKTQSHIDDWLRRRELGIGGRPFTCEKANQLGVGCGNCQLEAKEKWVNVGDKIMKTGEFSQPSPIRFAYKKKA